MSTGPGSDGMTGPQGLLAASDGPAGQVIVALDVGAQRFLRDHEVGGRALLSTVMGVETMAVALRHVRPAARIAAVSGLQVGPPYLLPSGGRGSVRVELSGTSTPRCTVRSGDGDGDVHFTAELELAPAGDAPPARRAVPASPGSATVAGRLVYGLYFHGPSFRVVDEAWLDGPTITARLQPHRPAAVDGSRSLTAPLLVELCLQTAGLWDLAVHDAMTIPHRIERIRRFSPVDADGPGELYAVVRAVADEAGRRFDALIVDGAGQVHVAVDGYRTTPFGHPYDVVAAERIRRALGSVGREQRPGLG